MSNPLYTPSGGNISETELDNMTVEELEAALMRALDSMTDETYDAAIVSAYLNALERKDPMPEYPDVETAWDRFEKKLASVCPDTDLAHPLNRPHLARRVGRVLLVATLSMVVILGGLFTAQAMGADVFGALARWTEDVFSFGQITPDSEVSDNSAQEMEAPGPGDEFATLQEAFDAYGMTEVHEPAWLPDGYTLDSVDVLAVDDPFLRIFAASYTDGEGRVGIDIKSYEEEPLTQVQKTDDPIEFLKKNGRTFYLIQNTENYTIAWHTDQYEYFLVSKEGTDILWKVAESMFS